MEDSFVLRRKIPCAFYVSINKFTSDFVSVGAVDKFKSAASPYEIEVCVFG